MRRRALAILVLSVTALTGPATIGAGPALAGPASAAIAHVAAGSTPSPAPSSSPAVPASRLTFGLQPWGANGNDGRGEFSYSVTPGAGVTDRVAVRNYGTAPITLSIYARDAFNTPEGGFDVGAAATTATEAGVWVTLGQDKVTVPARGMTVVPFSVRVPQAATPGDHSAGIVVSLTTTRTDPSGDRVAVENRVGSRVHFRVVGELRPQLEVQELSAGYGSAWAAVLGRGDVLVRYRVANTGNVRMSAAQTVQVRGSVGPTWSADDVEDVPELLPGNSVDFETTVSGVLAMGLMTARVHLEPVASLAGAEQAPFTETTSFVAFPFLLVFLVVLLALGYYLWRRRRKRTRGPGPDIRRSPDRSGEFASGQDSQADVSHVG